MSAPTTFSLSRLYNLLGVKGGDFPRIGNAEVQPVSIVANLDALTPEIVEPRGMVGTPIQNISASNRFSFEIRSRSNGGLLIEQFIWQSVALTSPLLMSVQREAQAIPNLPNERFVVEVGDQDRPTKSQVFTDIGPSVGGAVTQATSATTSRTDATFRLNPQARVFIPPGFRFIVWSTDLGADVAAFVIWREVEEVVGVS